MAGKVLIVDDISTNRIVLRVKLAAAFYEVEQARSGSEAAAMVAADRPDLVLLNTKLPDADALALCREWKADPATADMPVVMLAPSDHRGQRLAALQAGADEVLSRPLDDVLLKARLRSLLRAHDAAQELKLRDCTYRSLGFAEPAAAFEQPPRVALLANDRAEAVLWKQGLEPLMAGHFTCHDAKSLMRDISEGTEPDVVVLALRDGDDDRRIRLLSEMRAHPGTRYAGLMVVLCGDDRAMAADAFDLGAHEALMDGFHAQEAALRIHGMVLRKRRADRVRDSLKSGLQAAMLDPLTGLFNRRYAMPHLARIAEDAVQNGRDFAVMLADLDHFKQVNDMHGHGAGDAVLVELAKRLKANLRSRDLLARIGGEEFLIALPETDLHEARLIAQRLCTSVASQPFDLPGPGPGLNTVPVTISIGLAMGHHGLEDAQTVPILLDRADRALYRAKRHGRNQVTLSRSAA